MERLSRSSRLAQPGISPLDEYWDDFDSDADLSMNRTRCISYYDVFWKQFDRSEYFSPLEFSTVELRSASESIQPVLIIWVRLNSNQSAHETLGVRAGLNSALTAFK